MLATDFALQGPVVPTIFLNKFLIYSVATAGLRSLVLQLREKGIHLRVRFWGNWASTVTPRLTLLSLLGLLLDLLQLLHQLFLLPFNLLLLFLCQLTLLLLIFQKGTRKEKEGCLQDSKVHGASRSSAI